MNNLGYRIIEENGLSIELMIDEIPLGELIGSRDMAIPFWLFDKDLPHFPPYGENRDNGMKIVTVCSCGEYGCSHTHCRIVQSENIIILSEFEDGNTGKKSDQEFHISKENYKAVISQILQKINEHKAEQ